MKEGGEAAQSQPSTYLKIQVNSEEITKNQQMKRATEKPQDLVHMEEPAPTQPVHTYTTENKTWETD